MIRRFLTRLLYILLSAFVIVSALLYALAGTEPGTRWLIASAIRLGGLELNVGHSRGSLLGGLDLYGVRWHDASAELDVARIRLRWRPLDMFVGQLRLDRVSATHLFLALPTSTTQTANTHHASHPRISVPFRVVLKRLDIRDLIVKQGARVWRIGGIQAHASLHGSHLHVDALRISTPQGHLQLIGAAVLTPPYAGNVRLDWTWRTSDGTELAGHGSLGGDMNRIAISQRLRAPFTAQLQGRFDPRTLDADLELAWNGAHWPLQGKARLNSPNGQLIFKGTPDAYEATLKTRIDGPGLPAAAIALQAMGNRRQVRLNTLHLTTLKGRISGRGLLAWEPRLHWQAQLHGVGIDPAGIRPAWPGQLAFDLTAEGDAETFVAQITRLAGTLRGAPIGATADVRWQQNILHLSTVELRVGTNRIRLSGRAQAQRGDLAVEFDLPQVQSLLPTMHGQLSGKGEIKGPWNWPRITASARGKNLSWNGVEIRRARLDIAPAGGDTLSTRIALDDVRRGHRTLTHVLARITGTPARQRLTLDASASDGRFVLAAEGGFDTSFDRWRGHLNRLEVAPAKGETWRLGAPALLDIGAHRQQLAETCLYPTGRQGAGLCARLDAGAGRLNASVRLEALPLALINPWLQPGMSLAGHLQGTARINGPLEALNGQLMAHIDDGKLRLNETNSPLTVAFTVPVLRATLSDGALNAKLVTELPQQRARIEAQADIGKAQKTGARRLSGALRLDLPALSVLRPFVPQLHSLNGRAQARLAFDGTLARPHLSGTVTLDDGSAILLSTGTRLEHVQLHARVLGNSDNVTIDARANSGPGSLLLKGQILGLDSPHPRLTAKVSGKNFQAVNLPQVEALISPSLDIAADRSRIKIRGKVEIPQAKINVHRLPAQAVSVSPDVVIVGQTQPRKPGPTIDADIDVSLGDKVSIEAFGLNGDLSGSLLLRQQDGAPTTANGSLNILNGTYTAYGLNLAISRGVLNFAGPVDNPGLDVVAERKTDTVTAKLTVGGTLQSPRSQVSSDPPMSQANALSWLLTGHGLNEASSSDTALLLKAVYSMNVNDSGGGLVNQLKQRTGLSEISVQGGNTLQQSALVLGKYLTPDIYVRYTTGLFERMNTLALTYKLTRHLSVEAQSGAAQALDLLYQIDFGGS